MDGGQEMKKEILAYLIGLCQAASAALLVSAVVMPPARAESIFACYIVAAVGLFLVYQKNRED